MTNKQQTAIFRPDENWKEKLKLSHEAAQRAMAEGSDIGAESWRVDHSKDEDTEAESDSESVSSEGGNAKTWKVKRTLRK